ncbi:SymE family type I addiction module toxin [Pragia fontium]|uniref:SymE family type I addiction module toxin n=1 Tax=Pragia fontium TaxID=82985 RepID=UPI0028527052|nr:SymE family type I addiction module toxin [Pragia fontium]
MPPSAERFYTIGAVPTGWVKSPTGWVKSPTPRPQLTIKGRYLEEMGFLAGRAVVIKVEQDQLIIRLAMQI